MITTSFNSHPLNKWTYYKYIHLPLMSVLLFVIEVVSFGSSFIHWFQKWSNRKAGLCRIVSSLACNFCLKGVKPKGYIL